MTNKSIKKNVILNAIRTLMGVVFPLISFPYASRILLPEGIGKVQFATSIVSYFSLIASLGIMSYGVREGARCRDSKKELSLLAKELLIINLIATIFAYLLFFVVIFSVEKLYDYRPILLICSTSMIFSSLGMEWLYSAMEDFEYITYRSLLFQIISLLLLFLFVRSSKDFLNYAIVTVFSSVGSNALNFINCKKYISLRGIRVELNGLKRHIRPILILFIMSVTSSIYTILDTSMLGFLTDDYQVGIYGAATKINRIVLNLVVSGGIVLLPRLSYYCGVKDKKNFYTLSYKLCDIILLLGVPASIGLSVLAEPIIMLVGGSAYKDSVLTMRLINPIIVIVGLSNYIGVHLFMPLRKEKWTLYSDLAGAVINICFNMILIPRIGAVGAGISSVLAELTVTSIQLYLAKEFISIKKIFRMLKNYLIMGMIMGVCVVGVNTLVKNKILNLLVGILVGVVVYSVELIISKNSWAMNVIQEIKDRIAKHIG